MLSDTISAGQAVYRGPVILSWDEALAEGRDPTCGYNVVLHEFAHQLDYLDNVINGTPPLGDAALEARWKKVMQVAFGACGIEELAPGMTAVKRTSPSGGALHPIEAFPLVIDVEGLAPGFYHYRGDDHRLELVARVPAEEARPLAARLVAGQDYFADAAALVFHVARLDRQFWKYRQHPKAMRVLLLDSGHLSQTFYLAATDLGLGAFYTAAINDADIAGILCLDSSARMVIGANGIGVADPTRDQLHLRPVAMPRPD